MEIFIVNREMKTNIYSLPIKYGTHYVVMFGKMPAVLPCVKCPTFMQALSELQIRSWKIHNTQNQ